MGSTSYESVGDGSSTRRHSLNFGTEESSENQFPCEDKEDTPREKVGEDPEIGMEFETEQEAYDFYNEYAGRNGFGIRKEWANKNKDGVITRRKFVCSKSGSKKIDKRHPDVRKPRDDTRTGCLAHMLISIQPNGKYVVIQIERNHKHHCTPTKSVMFRSQKKIPKAQDLEGNMMDGFEVTPNAPYDLMGSQVGGCRIVDFLSIDCKNYLCSKQMRSMEMRDVGDVLQYLQKMVADDPMSFYAIQVDEDQKITNIFWADSKMIMDYDAFGDVVCFDTTFKTNDYDRPFAPFVGINNHKQIAIFGAALMYDETVESFLWVFKTFLEVMSGKQPQTILTDQDVAIAEAIPLVMPDTCHRICIWHMYQNVAKHLSHVFRDSKTFGEDFGSCVFDYEDESEFLDAWEGMLDKYQLRDNQWLQRLLQEREKWALVYGRQTFCADIQNTQRSESLNNILKAYLSKQLDLLQFFDHFERLVADKRSAEIAANFEMTQTTPHMVLDVPILVMAGDVYTPVIFKLFQDEYCMGLGCEFSLVELVGTVGTYKVRRRGRNHEYTVWHDSKDHEISCSCRKFEFCGILCGHALRIVDIVQVPKIPDRYILQRWRKDAKQNFVSTSCVTATSEKKKEISQRYRTLMRSSLKLNTVAAENEGTYIMAMNVLNNACIRVSDIINKSCQTAPTDISTPIDISATKKGLDAGGSQHGDSVEVQGCDNTLNPQVQVLGVKSKEGGRQKGPRLKSSLEQTVKKCKKNPTSSTPACEPMRQPIPTPQLQYFTQGMYQLGLDSPAHQLVRAQPTIQLFPGTFQPSNSQLILCMFQQSHESNYSTSQNQCSMLGDSQEGNRDIGDSMDVPK